MLQFSFFIIMGFFTISCVHYVERTLPPFPKKPEFQKITKDPIIDKNIDTFSVTDEFVIRATQEHEYLKTILNWREDNNVKY